MDSEAALDYPRQIKAARISGSALILLLGVLYLWITLKISAFSAIFETKLEGGVDALPALTIFLISNQLPLLGVVALVSLTLLWGVRTARRLSTFIYLATAAVILYVIYFVLVDLALTQPLTIPISKFQG